MVRPYQHQPRVLAVGARRGLETHAVHARDLVQKLLRAVHDFQAALGAFLVLQGMYARKTGKGSRLLVYVGIVLHGAGAQGIEAVVHPVGLLGQFGIVALQVHFGYLGQPGRRLPEETFVKPAGGHVGKGQQVLPAPGTAQLKQQFHSPVTSPTIPTSLSI